MDDMVLTYMIYVSDDNDKPSVTIKVTGLDNQDDAEYIASKLDNLLLNNHLDKIKSILLNTRENLGFDEISDKEILKFIQLKITEAD